MAAMSHWQRIVDDSGVVPAGTSTLTSPEAWIRLLVFVFCLEKILTKHLDTFCRQTAATEAPSRGIRRGG